MNKMLMFSCVKVDARRITVKGRGIVGIALGFSARGVSRIMIMNCNRRGGTDIVNSVSAVSVTNIGIPNSSVSDMLTKRLTKIMTVGHAKRPKGTDTTSFCVQKMSSFANNGAPLMLMSKVRQSLSLMSMRSVTSFSVLGSTSTSTICNIQKTGNMVLVAAGGKTRNGPIVGTEMRTNFARPAGVPRFMGSTR